MGEVIYNVTVHMLIISAYLLIIAMRIVESIIAQRKR
jgi:uncharacterized MnhB-related membrane protein